MIVVARPTKAHAPVAVGIGPFRVVINVLTSFETRALHFDVVEKKIKNLPLLKNDTSDIIVYRDDIQIYKKNINKRTVCRF